MTPTETIKQAIEDICGAKLCEINSMSSRGEMLRLMEKALANLRALLAQMEKAEPVQVLRCPGEEDEFASIVKRLNAALHTTSMANANLRTENEELRLELGKWRGWLAENKVALKQARAEEREAIVALAAEQGWVMRNEDPFEDAVRDICTMRSTEVKE